MNPSIVVIGSLSLDMVFQVPRRPLKGETVKGYTFATFVGGKGNNQALAASYAGGKVAMIGKIGSDNYGEQITNELIKAGVDVSFLFVDETEGTGLANIYVDRDGDNSIIIVPRSNNNLKQDDIDKARGLIESCELIMLQLEIPMETVIYAAQLAKKLGKKVMLNPAPAPEDGKIPEELLKHVDYFVPNQTEAELVTGAKIPNKEAAVEAALELMEHIDGTVLITMGEEGVVGMEKGNKPCFMPAFSVKAIDTTAAGDAFLGCLAKKIVAKASMNECLKAACAAGALATTKKGAQPSLPTNEEIKELVVTSLSAQKS